MKDGIGIFFSFAYVLLVLIVAKKSEARGWASPFVTRKLVHLFVGSWIVPTFFLFNHWFTAIVPPFSFIWVNLYFVRRRFFSFEMKERGYGTVYFPISVVFLLTFFWETSVRLCACVGGLVMAWGDPLAAIVGKRWGRHGHHIGGVEKSFEGSCAMWGGAFVASWVGFLLFQPTATLERSLVQSGLIAFVATLLESFTPRGLDNITVPLGSAWLSYLLLARF